ncbi:MAG: hypothetical protein PHR83_01935 [Paludibacter sp.]|nr:hypothetical protein [Paludibacter sp.]
MNDLKSKIRLIKSRMPYEELYMSVFEDVFWELYIKERRNYYNFLNVVNLDKILLVLYNNHFITYDNVDDFSANFFEMIDERYYLCYSNENGAYNCSNEILLNKYYTKQSLAFNSLVSNKPEYKNLLTDIIKVFDNYILNLDYMYSILHPTSVIYSLAEEFSYSEVIVKLKEYMIEEGIALPINSFLDNDLLKPNKSIDRKLKPVGLFKDRLAEYGDDMDLSEFWSGAVYYALIENRDINQMYYQSKLTDTYIDNDIMKEHYIAEFQYPDREIPCHDKDSDKDDDPFKNDFFDDEDNEDNEDLGELKDFFDDDDDDDE